MSILFDPVPRGGGADRDFLSGRRLPDTPCPHPPGSEARLATLAQRAAGGCSLWHPDDCTDQTEDLGHQGRPAALRGCEAHAVASGCPGRAVVLSGVRGLVF